jgi:hypothetical protein
MEVNVDALLDDLLSSDEDEVKPYSRLLVSCDLHGSPMIS